MKKSFMGLGREMLRNDQGQFVANGAEFFLGKIGT